MNFNCVIPSEAEGPRIFLDSKHFDSAQATLNCVTHDPNYSGI